MDRFTFGKYKGKLIMDIIRVDPDYVRWAVSSVNNFSLNKEQNKALQRKPTWIERRLSYIYSDNYNSDLEY